MPKLCLFLIAFILGLECFSQTAVTPYDYVYVNFNNGGNLDYLLINPEDSLNSWTIGTPDKEIFTQTPSLYTDTNLYYQSNLHSWFQVKLDDFSSGGPTYVSLDMVLDTEPGKDGMYIEVSKDGGESFINIIHDTIIGPLGDFFNFEMTEGLYSSTDTLFNGIQGFSGSQDINLSLFWIKECIGPKFVSKAKSINDSLIVRFNFISDSVETEHEGVQITDFEMQIVLCFGLDELATNSYQLINNPSSDFIEIVSQVIGDMGSTYILFDELGRIVKQDIISQKERFSIDIESLKPGMYMLRIIDKDEKPISFHKVIKS
jgi:hypothetical protein